MELDFELFEEGQRGRTRDRVHVTLHKTKHLYFSGKAVEALGFTPRGDAPAGAPGRPDGVALLFDKRRQIIGVMPSALNRKHTYELRTKKNMGKGRLISAKNFCERYGINPPETVAFPQAEVNRDGILLLDLQKALSVGRKN